MYRNKIHTGRKNTADYFSKEQKANIDGAIVVVLIITYIQQR